MIHLGDITKINGHRAPIVDVITGGSPCQDLSVAGRRAGLDGERSGLFMEQIRIVKEMRDHDRELQGGRTDVNLRPRYMVWENVPGAFSSNKGRDFQAVLSEIVRIVEPQSPDVPMPQRGGWPKAGCIYDEMGRWSVAWRVHDAQFWGVPQRRKRIALVADFGGLSAPEVLFERKGLHRHSEQSGEEEKRAAGYLKSSIGDTGKLELICLSPDQTIKTNDNGIAFSLKSRDFKSPPCLLDAKQKIIPLEHHPNDSRIGINNGGAIQTLASNMGTGGGNVPLIISIVKSEATGLNYCIGNGQVDQLRMSDKVGALNCMHDQQAVLTTKGMEPICIGNGQVNDAVSPSVGISKTLNCMDDTMKILDNMVVRRLTPLECERLQGFPDGWTDIGEWTDSKGKRHKDADSPRYKALGNSIALPFWQRLARRITAQYDRDITMASLFDGIGGFPLVFERCGAKAVWASEIEEFPIAVTKRRFQEA